MSTRAKLATQLQEVTRTYARGARGRAHDRVVFAAKRIPGALLGEHLGVSASAARHQKSDDDSGALTEYCTLLADPRVTNESAGRLLAAALASFEERYLYAPTNVLRERLEQLRTAEEHRLESEQNRAMVVNAPDRSEAYLAHAGALIELAVIEGLLAESVH